MHLIAPFVALSASLTCSVVGDTSSTSSIVSAKLIALPGPDFPSVTTDQSAATGTSLQSFGRVSDGTPTAEDSSYHPSATSTTANTDPAPTDYTYSLLRSFVLWVDQAQITAQTLKKLIQLGRHCEGQEMSPGSSTFNATAFNATACGRQFYQIFDEWKKLQGSTLDPGSLDDMDSGPLDNTVLPRWSDINNDDDDLEDQDEPPVTNTSDDTYSVPANETELAKSFRQSFPQAIITFVTTLQLGDVFSNCSNSEERMLYIEDFPMLSKDPACRKRIVQILLDWRHEQDKLQDKLDHGSSFEDILLIPRQSDVDEDDGNSEDQDEPADTTSSQDLSGWIRKFNLVLNKLKITQETGQGQNSTIEQVNLVLNEFVAAHNQSRTITGRSINLTGTSDQDENQDSDLDAPQDDGQADKYGYRPDDGFDGKPHLTSICSLKSSSSQTLSKPKSALASTTLTSDSSTITVFVPVSTPAYTMASSVQFCSASITPSPSSVQTSTCTYAAYGETWVDKFCTSSSSSIPPLTTITADQGVRLIDYQSKGQGQDILNNYQDSIYGTKKTKYIPDPDVPGPKPCVRVYGFVKLIGHDCRIPEAMADLYFLAKLPDCKLHYPENCTSSEEAGQAFKDLSDWQIGDASSFPTRVIFHAPNENLVSIPPEVSADMAAELSAGNSTELSNVRPLESGASSHSGMLLMVIVAMLTAFVFL